MNVPNMIIGSVDYLTVLYVVTAYVCIYACSGNEYATLCIIDISVLVTGHRGPCSKYDISIPEGNFKGELEIVWESDPLRVGTAL